MMRGGTVRSVRSCRVWALAACALLGHVPLIAHSMPTHAWAWGRAQPVQWSAPLNSGLTPEQLLFALRKRELGAHNYAACSALGYEVQRLQRSQRKAAPQDRAPTETQLAQAQQRQHALRCPAAKKL